MLSRAIVAASFLAPLWVASPARALTVHGRVLVEPGGEPVARAAVLVEGDASQPRNAKVDEVWISFVPKVQVVAPGSTLTIADRDDESHTAHAWLGGKTLFNRASVPDEPPQTVALDTVGVVTLTCDIHRAMRAYVLVSRARASAVTGVDGTFELELGPGRYTARVWRFDDEDDVASPPGVEPGRAFRELDAARPWTFRVPPARRAAPPPPMAAPLEPEPPLTVGSTGFRQFQAIGGWPRGPWALVLAALTMAGGVLAAFGAIRLAARRGWSLLVPVSFGLSLAGASAALIYLGLNGAVGAALGLGTLIGTAVFAAEDQPKVES
jgi:plastocyanin